MSQILVDQESTRKLYDERYEGDYMSGDCFTKWSHSGVELQRVKDTLGQIPLDQIASILDYGCGQGEWTDQLGAIFPAATVKGIDISETAIRKAGIRRPQHEFRQFDGVRAPFEGGVFDLVFSYHVLEHVLRIDHVVADMARLVRQGGFLCIIFPCGNPWSFEANLVARINGGMESGPTGEMRFFYEDPTHLRRMQSGQIIRLFGKHGARIRTELYAHQLFGAIEWISKSGSPFVRDLLSVRRAVSLRARMELIMIGTIIRSLALLHDVSTADLAKPRAGWKRAVLYSLLPMRILGRAVSRALESLAHLEWRRSRLKKNGSAQFLVFQK